MKRFNLAGGSEEPPDSGDDSVDTPQGRRGPNRELERQTGAKMDEAIRSRSLWYVIGGSLAFEAVILSLATWIFCRRDF